MKCRRCSHALRRRYGRAGNRKIYRNHDGASFQVGTIVSRFRGAVTDQKGIVLRILPPYRGDEPLGHRAWVAFDMPTRYRRHSIKREGRWTEEASEREATAQSGNCFVIYTYLDHLTPHGQARMLPRCVLEETPNALRTEVRGRWAR